MSVVVVMLHGFGFLAPTLSPLEMTWRGISPLNDNQTILVILPSSEATSTSIAKCAELPLYVIVRSKAT